MTQAETERVIQDLPRAPAMDAAQILVVEDERIVALDLQERLKELGYSVPAVAATGEQAVEMVEQNRPDLILMDIHLQGEMDGVEAADRIRDQFDLPVIFLTAFSDESTLQRARFTGPFGYLVKPFEIENLHSTIKMALYRHQLDQELEENARFLVLLNDITRAALETTGLEGLVQITVDRLIALFHADGCHLYLWDESSQRAIPAAAGAGWHTIRSSPGQRSLDRLCEAVLELSCPLVIKDTARATHVGLTAAELNPTRSVLALPLISGERKLGAVLILNNEPRNFSQDEIDRGEQAALHTALAIAKGQLVENLEATVLARTNEIASEKEKSETILRNVDHAIMMTDRELVIRYINPAYSALTGYSEEDALGKSAGAIGAGARSDPVTVAIQAALAQGESWHGEVIGRRKDGRTYDAALSLAPVFDADGILVGVVSSHQDVSQSRDLERARRHLMTSVSHQLRTPITSILLYTHLLQTIENLPEKSRRHLQVLDQQVQRLEDLIEDILQMTDLDSGRAVETWEPIPLAFVVREVVNGYRERADETGLTLTLHPIPPDLPPVMGDQVWLGQALAELVDNALAFTLSGGSVALELTTADQGGDSWVAIAVRDSGPGIPPGEIGSIFERFFRGSLTEAGDFPGTGLGLCIAQEIVGAHGGRISVDSTAGRGSTFTLWLPTSSDDTARRD